ncbi:hypothetical protein OROMI_004890 [Orobanche minor]
MDTVKSKGIQKSIKNQESALVIYEVANKRRRNEANNNPQQEDDYFVESGEEAPTRKKTATKNVTRDKENEKAKAKSKGKAPMIIEQDTSEEDENAEEIPNDEENKGNKEEVADEDMNVDTGIEEAVEDEEFPSLPSRCNLITFTKTLSKLNEKQANAIEEIGFRVVRDLNINTVLSRLAYWVIDNFNRSSSELLLTGNQRIIVTEDDVTRMMAYIPDTHRHKITIKKLHDAALRCVDGGEGFKRLFMVAIQCSFMESTANGYVSPYILNCLVPDVRYKVQKIPREFTVIVNSKTKLLRNIEKGEIKGGCFVDGLPQEPIQIVLAPATHDNEVHYVAIPKTNKVAAKAAKDGAGVNIEVLSAAKKITKLVVHMMKLIETDPEDVMNMLSFHLKINKAMKPISCSTVLSTQTGSHATESTQEFNDFCNHRDVVKLLNDFGEELKKRDEQLVKLEEMPSFSLGLTQMWNSSAKEDFSI